MKLYSSTRAHVGMPGLNLASPFFLLQDSSTWSSANLFTVKFTTLKGVIKQKKKEMI